MPDVPESATDAVPASDIDGIDTEAPETVADTFPVVGIGASAGGLRAFQEFFSALPARPGMAFVLVQHLSPDHESALAELIQRQTEMEVAQVDDHPTVQPNHVYVIPPGKHIEVEGSHLQLVERKREGGRPAAVDHFFRTLSDQMAERAVCIVLSGTGSDGSLGLKAVKERGGLTMAQTPQSAEHDGMPRSAIGTDLVDVQGTPGELARRLVEIRDADGRITLSDEGEDVLEDDHQALQAIFAHLRERTAHDFAAYKRSTILRRLARRLQLTGQPDLPTYAAHLRATPAEVPNLLRDFLISVTQFFRDEDAFEALARDAVPALFRGKTSSDQVRVWVAGCATGEEAYSIAILLCEHAAMMESAPDIQIFATDIDDEALAKAREGFYAPVAAADVSPERRRRFFDTEDGGVRVKPHLRQMVLFARHNLLSDPPFSRLDLVTCRNVLIYLNREIQERVLATFHYALRPDGLLFLGSAESIGTPSRGFVTADAKARLYARRDAGGTLRRPSFVGTHLSKGGTAERHRTDDPPREGLVERYRDWTLDQYAPPRLLVDEHYDVTHVFGSAGEYLIDREGPVTQNVVDKVLRAFRVDLRASLFRAFSAGETTDTHFQRVEIGTEARIARLHVGPVGGAAAGDGLAEVVFIELDLASVEGLVHVDEASGVRGDDPTSERLEEELRQMRSRLQITVEEGETSNEELKASNEELQSINEELQSTTEELETSKEELQSTNEELTTVNHELKDKIDALVRANSDLQNLIASTDVGTLFLDRALSIKRYTPRAADLFNVIPSDVGRPFAHLSHRLRYNGLADDAQRVLHTLVAFETEVEHVDGRWSIARVAPYRTTDDRIDGVVLTLVDVTDLHLAREEASRRAQQQSVVAELGVAALEGGGLPTLFEMACTRVAECLETEISTVLRAREGDFVLEAGVGWPEGAIGEATVPDTEDTQPGYTLHAASPVVVQDIATEARFDLPELLAERDVRSGVTAAIVSPAGQPYGVLGAHGQTPQPFTDDDGVFVQSVANVLGDAVQRIQNENTIRVQLAEIEAVYGTAPVGLAFMDRELRYRRINGRLAEINGLAPEEHVGRRTSEILPTLGDKLEPLLETVLETGEAIEDLEVRGTTPRFPDEERVWLCSYVPEIGADGEVDGVSVVVRDITDRKKVEDELASLTSELESRVSARTAQVRMLATELTQAEQAERQRISQVLHDDLQQLLYAVQIKVQMLSGDTDDARRRSLVDEARTVLDRAIQAARLLTVDLSPPILPDEGFERALAWVANRMEEAHSLRVTVESPEGVQLGADIHVMLVRAVREMLFNIVKHAGVREAIVRVSVEDETVQVEVSDQGVGFDPSALDGKASGYGLFSSRERLKLIGGSVVIEASPGNGARVVLTSPVQV